MLIHLLWDAVQLGGGGGTGMNGRFAPLPEMHQIFGVIFRLQTYCVCIWGQYVPVVVYTQAVDADKGGSDSNTWCIWFVAVIINTMISSIMKITIRLNVMVSITFLCSSFTPIHLLFSVLPTCRSSYRVRPWFPFLCMWLIDSWRSYGRTSGCSPSEAGLWSVFSFSCSCTWE